MKIMSLAIVLITLEAFAQSSHHARSLGYPTPTIREEKNVIVDGVTETWRLQWKGVPTPYCSPDDASAITCPCSGFSYGESGDLYLTRDRAGIEIDRLHLTPLFEERHAAVVQRWPVYNRDLELAHYGDFPSIVSKRRAVQVMNFADYDHDGNRTEFYLQTDAESCKEWGVVIGLSKNNRRLHVFGTVSNPSRPLGLQKREWEALRKGRSGSVDVVDWGCGDHAAETQTELRLHWSAEGIDGVRREYTCSSHRHLISEEPLGN